MKLGISFHPGFMMPWRSLVNIATRAGVSVVEIKADDPKLRGMGGVRRLKDLLSSYDFELVVHAPYIDLNPASLNPLILATTRRILAGSIRLAETLEAQHLICHPGTFPPEYHRSLRRRALLNMTQLIRQLAQQATNSNIDLLIENLPRGEASPLVSTPEELRDFIGQVNVGIALDLGHANTMGDPQQFISVLAGAIKVVHLHDNHGETDEHLPLGRGTLRLRSCLITLSKVRYDGPIILQVRSIPGMLNSLRILRSLLPRITPST